jgi:hypothetical protein
MEYRITGIYDGEVACQSIAAPLHRNPGRRIERRPQGTVPGNDDLECARQTLTIERRRCRRNDRHVVCRHLRREQVEEPEGTLRV